MDLIVYQVMAGLFCAGVIFSLSYFVGYRLHFRKFKVQAACDREEMLTIERSLKAFWDNEKQNLENRKRNWPSVFSFWRPSWNSTAGKLPGLE